MYHDEEASFRRNVTNVLFIVWVVFVTLMSADAIFLHIRTMNMDGGMTQVVNIVGKQFKNFDARLKALEPQPIPAAPVKK